MGGFRGWSAAGAAAWALLHVYTSVHAFWHGLYQTYTGRTWVLLGVWLLGLLALDAGLAFGGPGPLRAAKWYWGFSAALYGALILVTRQNRSLPAWPGVLLVLGSLLAPMHQLTALSWPLLHKAAGLTGRVLSDAGFASGLLLCLIHFVYAAGLHRRAGKKGAPPDGPVGPGAGTVG